MPLLAFDNNSCFSSFCVPTLAAAALSAATSAATLRREAEAFPEADVLASPATSSSFGARSGFFGSCCTAVDLVALAAADADVAAFALVSCAVATADSVRLRTFAPTLRARRVV